MTKFLIIRFSSIGDIVLTTPVIRCIRQQVSHAEIHYLTKKSYGHIIANNPAINKCFLFADNLPEIIAQLKQENYDYIIDLHHNLRSFLIKSRLRTGNRSLKVFSFPKLNLEKWLMVNFKINRLPELHLVDRYFTTVKPLGVNNDGGGLDYFIPPRDEIDIQSALPSSHHAAYIGFVIGAKFATKRLPVQKIIAICKNVSLPVVLLGGREDEQRGQHIVKETGESVYNACGKYNLNQSASLIRQAKKIITHDTGLMHIAAAFKKEIISVWGNTIPAFGMTPYYGTSQVLSHIIQADHLSCRPCSKLGFAQCPKDHFRCMNNHDEHKIADLVNYRK